MRMTAFAVAFLYLACTTAVTPVAAAPAATAADGSRALDETPAAPGEWGFRPAPAPAPGGVSALNPPRFAWRPQASARSYTVQASRDASFASVAYEAKDLSFTVHAPPREFETGTWNWRFRAHYRDGGTSAWSTVRQFEIPPTAHRFPLPPREALLSRVPEAHPRLFVRPEELPRLRERATAELKPHADRLIAEAERLLRKPTPTDEPPPYPEGIEVKSESWRKLWWGARDMTIRTLDPAAQLGFAYQLTGDKRFGAEARRILLAAVKWDPRGATGYRYNDEAGMPYNALFSRTYSFVNDLLSEDERRTCRRVMTIRGREMYQHLCPSHFWTPYKSHQNRAWHFLGEVAIAFHGEIPEAGDWLWFSLNVFANVYPVWNDADGGWHEGMAYWSSYLDRFAWWADVMHAAVGIDAYASLPFFAQVGYLPMYAMPPGTPRGGFGDQTTRLKSAQLAPITGVFAQQAQNPYWQWYARAHRRGDREPIKAGYIPFVRAARYPTVAPRPPTDLPSSRAFRGVGQAFLNTTLLDARDNVEVLFKSSPFGTQSHGYDAQNAFQLYAFGQPLLVSSGQRDIYGSDHHANWMWETKSTNSITVGGRGQVRHSARAVGRITAFHASPEIDFVQGDASRAYDPPLKRFTRSILFIKPDLILIDDQLESDSPEQFQFWLHAPVPMTIAEPAEITIETENAGCRIALLAPAKLKLTQSDRYDALLRERVKLTEYHLKAETSELAAKQRFVTVIRPYRAAAAPAPLPTLSGDLIRDRQTEVRLERDGMSVRIGKGEWKSFKGDQGQIAIEE